MTSKDDLRPILDKKGVLHLDRTTVPKGQCEDCGQQGELRPYGKDGAWVCFKCAMKDEAEAKRQYAKLLADPKVMQ